MEMYEVGGCVRDELLGASTKDVDYTVVCEGGWDEMKSFLTRAGFEIFVDTPQYLTLRARFPKGLTEFGGRDVTGLTADFVLARKEGTYFDGRRPESVEPGTLEDDLRRRDFTVNALAKTVDGQIIDMFGGQQDLRDGVLRAVGNAEARLREDALRALRAVRFAVTKALRPNDELLLALASEWLPPLLASVSVERRAQELLRAFKHDTIATLDMLAQFPALREATFTDGLWLAPTLKSR